MKKNSAATTERVLGTDGRFYTPKKDPKKHAREVFEAERKAKLERLHLIEEELADRKQEVKDLKHTLDEVLKLNKMLKAENETLAARLEAQLLAKEPLAVEEDEPEVKEVTKKTKKKVSKAS